MKKVYLLLMFFVASTMLVNATDKTWEFSSDGSVQQDNSSTHLSAPYDFNGLELSPDFRVGNTPKNDPRSGVENLGNLSHYLRLHGASPAVSTPTIPTLDYVSFDVDGDAEIRILALNVISTPQTIRCVNSVGVEVGTFTSTLFSTSSDTCQVLKIFYNGPATTMTLYNTSGSASDYMRIWAVEVRPYVPTANANAVASTFVLRKVGAQLQNTTSESVDVYTIQGSKVLSSSDTNIDISGLAVGIYIASTPSGSMKFIK